MGPVVQNSANGAGAPQGDAARTTTANGKKAGRSLPLGSVRSLASPAEARLNDRLARVLGQRREPDAVIMGVLGAALFFGLIGLAVHFLWTIAIIVMALGLGYTVANSRRDYIDVVNQRAEGQPDSVA
jgi:Flp pilus assembly protein TadB